MPPPSAAETSTSEVPSMPANSEAAQPAHPRLHSQFADIAGAVRRMAGLQLEIWLTRIKMTAMRIVLVAMLAIVALMLALVAVIFLYAGMYHVLTDLMQIPTAWALLIFAGMHLLLAGILVVAAIGLINRGNAKAGHSGGAP